MAHYMAVYDNTTGNRLAFLENAYNIGYKLELNKLDSCSFLLPADDPKNSFCKPYRWVDIWDGDEFIGMFRILPSVQTRTGTERSVSYTCESVLATLMDDVLFGWHEIGNIGVYTQEVLNYILAAQTTPRWQLAQCDFTHQYLYGWENENLLSALFSVANPFVEDYQWKLDTQNTPWRLMLVSPSTDVKSIVQYKKNLTGIKKTVDPSEICTRLYPLGYGEGVNQLDIRELNNDQYYLDAESQAQYGIVSRIWVDRRYEDVNSLYSAAVAMLNELSKPYITYEIDVSFSDLTNPIHIGDYIRVVDDEDSTDMITQVIAIQKDNVKGNKPAVKVTLANKARNVATTVADLADRQRINEVYAQGAVTLFTKSFADNADTRHPAELRFDLPANIVHINRITINANTANFRGYTKAIEGGGGTSTTSGGGGAFVSTSSAGGSNQSTTGGGGGTSTTSGATTLNSSNVLPNETTGSAVHNHGLPQFINGKQTWVQLLDGSGNDLGRVGWNPSGAHTHPEHTHSIDIPTHTHQFSWQHTHTVSVNDHTHSITLPDHVHGIEYGIFEGNRADLMRLVVDGNTVGEFDSISDLNIIPYLGTDDSGNVNRSTHTVQLFPINEDGTDTISRIEMDMAIQLFANSRGGGQY